MSYEEIDHARVREGANEDMKFLFSRLVEKVDEYSRWEVWSAALGPTTCQIQFPPQKGSFPHVR